MAKSSKGKRESRNKYDQREINEMARKLLAGEITEQDAREQFPSQYNQFWAWVGKYAYEHANDHKPSDTVVATKQTTADLSKHLTEMSEKQILELYLTRYVLPSLATSK